MTFAQFETHVRDTLGETADWKMLWDEHCATGIWDETKGETIVCVHMEDQVFKIK